MKIQTQFAVVQRGLHEYRLVGSVNDVLAVEDDLAKAVAREIRVRLTPQTQAELHSRTPLTQKHLMLICRATTTLNGLFHFSPLN